MNVVRIRLSKQYLRDWLVDYEYRGSQGRIPLSIQLENGFSVI